jgi:hypothetical protein
MKITFETIIKNTTIKRNNSTFLLKEKYDFLISEEIVKQLYARSQFSFCAEQFITLCDIPNVDICLRMAYESQSLGNGHGFFK